MLLPLAKFAPISPCELQVEFWLDQFVYEFFYNYFLFLAVPVIFLRHGYWGVYNRGFIPSIGPAFVL